MATDNKLRKMTADWKAMSNNVKGLASNKLRKVMNDQNLSSMSSKDWNKTVQEYKNLKDTERKMENAQKSWDRLGSSQKMSLIATEFPKLSRAQREQVSKGLESTLKYQQWRNMLNQQ